MILVTLTSLLAVVAAYLVMDFLTGKNKFIVAGRTVVITGGSQGLGLALAQKLAAKGANVVIVAQTVSKLEAALKQISSAAQNSSSQRFKYLSYDLRAPESASAILEEVTKWNGGDPPDVVLNCAGHCIPGFFASSSNQVLRDQMETVYWSSAQMAHATINEWIKPVNKRNQIRHENKPRHLIFVSSVVAFLPLAGYAPYTPAKAAMRSLADTLNQEIEVYNGSRLHPTADGPAAEIKIHAVFPMGILSPGYENEQKTKPALTQKLEEDDKPQQPDELAATIISELEAGKFIITSALIGHLMKGWAMGGSQRVGVMDYIWSWIGSIVILFVAPDFLSKCRKWGREKGLAAAR